MIFLKRWFAYTKTTFGEMFEYQEKASICAQIRTGQHVDYLDLPLDTVSVYYYIVNAYWLP
jgi:hypothetical protein